MITNAMQVFSIDFSDIFRTILAAALPVGELRLAIPLAMYVYKMQWYEAFILGVSGNMIPVLFLVGTLDRIERALERFPNPFLPVLRWRTEKLRAKQTLKFERYQWIALVILVAIPFPGTGAWTGSLAAWVFQIQPRRAIPLISIGVLIAGVIVTGITILGSEIAGFILKV